VSLGKTIVNVSAQGMQGYLPFVHGQAAGYLGTTQSAGATYTYPLGSSTYRLHQCLFHGAAVGNTTLNLLGYRLGDQERVKLGLLYFLDVQPYLLANEVFQEHSHFPYPLSTPPNDNTWSGGMYGYRYLIGLTLNLYQRNGGI